VSMRGFSQGTKWLDVAIAKPAPSVAWSFPGNSYDFLHRSPVCFAEVCVVEQFSASVERGRPRTALKCPCGCQARGRVGLARERPLKRIFLLFPAFSCFFFFNFSTALTLGKQDGLDGSFREYFRPHMYTALHAPVRTPDPS